MLTKAAELLLKVKIICFYFLFTFFVNIAAKHGMLAHCLEGRLWRLLLALCLGQCLRVSTLCGGIELNTMLIDEGFGTLDKSYLEGVVFCLNSLKKFGRTIGIISHLKELKEKIKTQIVVEKNVNDGSRIIIKS